MQPVTRRSYLVSLSSHDRQRRTAMRNALVRLGGSEILPGLFVVAMTAAERAELERRFADVRVKQH